MGQIYRPDPREGTFADLTPARGRFADLTPKGRIATPGRGFPGVRSGKRPNRGPDPRKGRFADLTPLCWISALGGDTAAVKSNITHDVEAAAAGADVFPRLLAQACALAGLREPALRWLQRAVARGFINYPFLSAHDPFFAGMRSAPDFVRVLDDVRSRWEAARVSPAAVNSRLQRSRR
jgi:hypothetical protein